MITLTYFEKKKTLGFHIGISAATD